MSRMKKLADCNFPYFESVNYTNGTIQGERSHQ